MSLTLGDVQNKEERLKQPFNKKTKLLEYLGELIVRVNIEIQQPSVIIYEQPLVFYNIYCITSIDKVVTPLALALR